MVLLQPAKHTDVCQPKRAAALEHKSYAWSADWSQGRKVAWIGTAPRLNARDYGGAIVGGPYLNGRADAHCHIVLRPCAGHDCSYSQQEEIQKAPIQRSHESRLR